MIADESTIDWLTKLIDEYLVAIAHGVVDLLGKIYALISYI